ncbi:MAG: hypothetical protein KGS72_17345 [Cyanobacteria bacterium REEB67]|nr:hypothetical protein [Cyanobacteria bacterium REEB67]
MNQNRGADVFKSDHLKMPGGHAFLRFSAATLKSITLTIIVGSLILPGLAQAAQDAVVPAVPVYRQPKRLSRPGDADSPVPRGGPAPFSLGAEEKHFGAVAPALHSGIDAAFPNIAPPLQSQAAAMDNSRNAPYALHSQQDNRFPDLPVGLGGRDLPVIPITTKVLANYDIELIVDQSGSMHTLDCPGWRSRWDWCGMQAHDLAAQLSPYVPKGLTITNFSNNYQVHPNASPQNIAELFADGRLGMGTRLAEPLSDRLNSYFSRLRPGSKPMLIAVITDGVPTPRPEPEMVADALIAASKRINDPHELTVVFFQIGGFDLHGRGFLEDLDQNLVRYGAKYDIVHTVDFDRLQQVGLAQGLVDSIQDFAREQTQAGRH